MTDAPLIDQPTAAPTRKVSAAGAAGAAATVLVWVASLAGLEVPAEAAAALAVLIASAAGYYTRERR